MVEHTAENRGVAGSIPALATCLAALALAGLAAAAAPKPEAVRPCSSRGDTDRPVQLPARIGARLGPLVIWHTIADPLSTPGPGAWPYYIKAPILLPARAVAMLVVPPEARQLVAFDAGSYGVGAGAGRRWVSSVQFQACAANVRAFPQAYKGTVGKYTAFPFGFGLARRSLCVPLEVWLPGRTTPIRRLVALGRRAC